MSKSSKKFFHYLILGTLLFIALIPILWIILTSFKSFISIMSSEWLFKPTLKNYKNIFFERGTDYPRYFLNSTIVATITTFLSVIVGTFGAYSLSRLKVPFKADKVMLGWLLFVRMIHPIALAIPFFIIIYNIGIYDTKIALIAVYTTMNLPFTIWMLKGFFEEVPISIEDAALIDGCSRFQVFYKVALPLIAPGVAATAIFCFMLSWNEFLIALILTSSPQSVTLPVGMARLSQQYFVKWGEMSASAAVYVIPIFVFTCIVQKHLIRVMTFGAVKG